MGDEVDDLRAKVLEQGLALEGLQGAAADAEERRKSNHTELLEMVAQIRFGREQRLYTAVGAGRYAATPASEHSDVGDGGREGERVPEGAGPFGGREGDWGHGSPATVCPRNPPDTLEGCSPVGL